jgi:hypothetical protein
MLLNLWVSYLWFREYFADVVDWMLYFEYFALLFVFHDDDCANYMGSSPYVE